MCWSPIIVLNFPPSFAYIFLNRCNIMSKNISALWEFVEYMFQYVWNRIVNRYPISHKCCTYLRRDTIFKSGPFALFGSVIWVFLKLLFIKIIFVGIMDLNFDCYNKYIFNFPIAQVPSEWQRFSRFIVPW